MFQQLFSRELATDDDKELLFKLNGGGELDRYAVTPEARAAEILAFESERSTCSCRPAILYALRSPVMATTKICASTRAVNVAKVHIRMDEELSMFSPQAIIKLANAAPPDSAVNNGHQTAVTT